MEHPELNFLIQREIQNDRIRRARNRREVPQSSTHHPVRRFVGSFLISIGTRLAPNLRPDASRPAVGGVAIAGRADR